MKNVIILLVTLVPSLCFSATYRVSDLSAFKAAIASANKNPGHDTIELSASFTRQSPLVPDTLINGTFQIVDDLTIVGIGAQQSVIDDHFTWIRSDGSINVGYPYDTGTMIPRGVSSLFRVNRNNVAGKRVNVTFENLWFTHMEKIVSADNSNVTFKDTYISNNTGQIPSGDTIIALNGGL